MARTELGNGAARYSVGPMPKTLRDARAAVYTLAVLAVLLVSLAMMARADQRAACHDMMTGTDSTGAVEMCRGMFGPRGY